MSKQWRVDEYEQKIIVGVDMIQVVAIVEDVNSNEVAEVAYVAGKEEDYRMTIARLIAAAPQMLEALEEIFDTADMNIYVQGGGLQDTTLLYLRPALQKAKAALEVARGTDDETVYLCD